jgi:hypothetical protein
MRDILYVIYTAICGACLRLCSRGTWHIYMLAARYT